MTLELTATDEELRNHFYSLKTPEDVADLLKVDYSSLIYYLYRKPKETQYTTFTIPKKSGGTRTILAPTASLKIIQRKLNQVLQSIYIPKPSVHGFVHAHNIVTNAEAHTEREKTQKEKERKKRGEKKRRRYILNIDLENFFPSINFGRVRGLFAAHPYNRPIKVATVLAQICCFDNQLPQGAPTSPVVSNMICSRLDTQLQKLAKANRCFYTRYVDDITFSTSMPSFPTSLAVSKKLETGMQIVVGEPLENAIEDNGFHINPNKVHLQPPHRRQIITGLIANEFPNVSRRYISQIRAMLHSLRTHGAGEAGRIHQLKYDKKHRLPDKKPPSFGQVLAGKIEFLGVVKGEQNPKFRDFVKQLKELDKTYSRELPPMGLRKIFVSYSHKDQEWLDRLSIHLSPMIRNREMDVWTDKKIEAGSEWRKEIEKALNEADAAILLVTPEFLASDFIMEQEVNQLLEAAKSRGLNIFWIAVRSSSYKRTPIERYQGANNPATPLQKLLEETGEQAVADELVKICEKITDKLGV